MKIKIQCDVSVDNYTCIYPLFHISITISHCINYHSSVNYLITNIDYRVVTYRSVSYRGITYSSGLADSTKFVTNFGLKTSNIPEQKSNSLVHLKIMEPQHNNMNKNWKRLSTLTPVL